MALRCHHGVAAHGPVAVKDGDRIAVLGQDPLDGGTEKARRHAAHCRWMPYRRQQEGRWHVASCRCCFALPSQSCGPVWSCSAVSVSCTTPSPRRAKRHKTTLI